MHNNILPKKNLHDIFIGLMLGDGHIYRSSPTSNSRFEMSFGKDRQSFADSIGYLFKEYSNTGIKIIYYEKGIFFF
jgi:LAGLIDADG DNA endonuclease family